MNLLKCIYVHTRNQLLLVFPRMSLIRSHPRQTHRLQMGHPWPSHHMACRCTHSCHHNSRRHQARDRLWTQSDRPKVFSNTPTMLWTVRRISPDRPTLAHTDPHTDYLSCAIYGGIIRVQPRTIRPCHGQSVTLRRTVRICHGSTDVFRRTVRLYMSPRVDRPSCA
jgi:hypothetical protein